MIIAIMTQVLALMIIIISSLYHCLQRALVACQAPYMHGPLGGRAQQLKSGRAGPAARVMPCGMRCIHAAR